MNKIRVSGVDVNCDAQSDSRGKSAGSGEKQDRSVVQLCAYRVVSIVKEDCGASCANDAWYKYVVGNGKSIITGHRKGAREQVEAHAEWFVAELNARRGRGYNAVLSWWRGRPTQKSTETDTN